MPSTRKKLARGCLGCLGIFVALGIVLIPLLYLEEDWRGAHELAAAKQRWLDAGYSLNPADYVPPPVPDDKNLAALPIFTMEPDPLQNGRLTALQLTDATFELKHGGYLWTNVSGAKHDLNELVGNVHAACAKMFPGKTPPTSPLAQLEELYPVIVDLRAAAPSHPAFRLKQNYLQEPPWDRPMSLTVEQIAVAKLLGYHARLALGENQHEVALEDIRIGLQVARGAGEDPSLVGGLVSLGIVAITRASLDDQLAKHGWSDAQLAALQAELKRFDALALYQFTMRGECAVNSVPLYEALKRKPSAMARVVGMAEDYSEDENHPKAAALAWYLWAGGWWDMNAARIAELMLRETECVDLKTRRVDLDLRQKLEVEVETEKELPGVLAPWKMLYCVMAGVMTDAVHKFAQGQAQLDEDRIVCGLERYRLAQGAYPSTLDSLVPAYIDELPHDVINGEPFHYRLNPDGTFLLYSVGWNRVDDGGKVGYNKYVRTMVDYDVGDWVWPMNQR